MLHERHWFPFPDQAGSMTAASHWLIFCHHRHGTDAAVITTDHAAGPLGHVPLGEEASRWLCAEAFGLDWEEDMTIETRPLGPHWAPEVWSCPPIQPGTSLRMR
jgi:hypothetical protein